MTCLFKDWARETVRISGQAWGPSADPQKPGQGFASVRSMLEAEVGRAQSILASQSNQPVSPGSQTKM